MIESAIPSLADAERVIPAAPGARRDAIDAAQAVLASEERRLARLGFERPLARVRQARRFWSFVAALHALPARTLRDGASRRIA